MVSNGFYCHVELFGKFSLCDAFVVVKLRWAALAVSLALLFLVPSRRMKHLSSKRRSTT